MSDLVGNPEDRFSQNEAHMKSADLSADHRPIAKTPKLLADGKNYNKVVIIYFLSADEKRAKIWHFIGR